ncbi:hypothetical protein AB0L41_46615 [Amycolatopsis mediterranei]|uniref:hypothetical protein n=1 Tax=Amycolatopsis mediterranei TaxID=33910 RepID=UPI003443D569
MLSRTALRLRTRPACRRASCGCTPRGATGAEHDQVEAVDQGRKDCGEFSARVGDQGELVEIDAE